MNCPHCNCERSKYDLISYECGTLATERRIIGEQSVQCKLIQDLREENKLAWQELVEVETDLDRVSKDFNIAHENNEMLRAELVKRDAFEKDIVSAGEHWRNMQTELKAERDLLWRALDHRMSCNGISEVTKPGYKTIYEGKEVDIPPVLEIGACTVCISIKDGSFK